MSNEATNKTINGVDVTSLNEIKAAVIDEPKRAGITYLATNRWIEGAHNRSTIRDFFVGGELDTTRRESFVVHNDAAKVVLGDDRGANPLEYVASALLGCLTTTLVYHAAIQGVRIESIESSIEADQDARGFLGTSNNVRNGFENLRLHFKIVGEASEEKLRELVLLAQKRSPVYDVITNPGSVVVTGEVKRVKQAA